MVRRLTDRPFPIRATVVESTVNVYTEVAITLPIAPVLGAGKLQAVELMAIVSDLQSPDPEAGQNNSIGCHLAADPDTALSNINIQGTFWKRFQRTRDVTVTSVGEIFLDKDEIQYDDLTDYDGGGVVVAEQTIHLGIQGAGNAAAKRVRIKVLAHLVELDADDAITLLLEAD